MTKGTGHARQQILEVASRLFYREGFRAVGVDTIVEQSGVAKMTLYRYFPSKDDLIVAYLEQSNNKFWQWFDESISSHLDAPRDQLIALFQALGTQTITSSCHGCSFQTAAAEFPEPQHPGHRVALAHKQAVRARLYDLATKAGATSPGALADQLLLLMDGAFVAARMFNDATTTPANQVAQAAAILIQIQFPS